MPSVNWDQLYEEAGSVDDSPAPKGKHYVKIEKGEWKESSNGKDMFAARARILNGPGKGKALFARVTISPENPIALQIGLRHLAALGLTQGKLKSLSDPEQEEYVVGRTCFMETSIGKWKGKERSEVDDIIPDEKAASEEPPPPDDDGDDTPPPVQDSAPPPPPFEDDDD